MLVMYAGVCAGGYIQRYLAQCPKYLIVFFYFHPGFWNWEDPGRFLLKASATSIVVHSIYSCDPGLIS